MKLLVRFAAVWCIVVGVSGLLPGMFTGFHILMPAIVLVAAGIALWIPVARDWTTYDSLQCAE